MLDSKIYCDSCWDATASDRVRCISCGRFVPVGVEVYESNSPYCTTCWQETTRRKLQANYTKPRKFISGYSHSEGTVFVSTVGGAIRFYGLELEADNGIDDTDDQPRALLEELYQWVEFNLKTDSSIEGFETVSIPLTLDYIRRHLRLDEWCKIMLAHGMKADDPEVHAGMHVHISKDAFGDTTRKQNKAIAAFTYLINRNEFRTQMREFSRRRGNYGYCQFYDSYPYSNTTITKVMPQIMAENRRHRNRAVNFHIYRHSEYIVNPATVEVRLFKGSLRKSTIVAAVELLDLFVDISIQPWTEESLRALTWQDICRRVPAASTCLKEYLKRRNIWED